MLSGATILATADCGTYPPEAGVTTSAIPGGSGASHAECIAFGQDRGHSTSSRSTADVFITDMSVAASVNHQVYPFAPLPVSSRAMYQADFAISFLGASGFGFFKPCFTFQTGGGDATATATLLSPPVTVPSFGTGASSSVFDLVSGSNCDVPTNPGDIAFAFGQTLNLRVTLEANDGFYRSGQFYPGGGARVTFPFAFNVSQALVDEHGVRSYQPLPSATWSIMELAVPEPATVVLMALGLALTILHRRAV